VLGEPAFGERKGGAIFRQSLIVLPERRVGIADPQMRAGVAVARGNKLFSDANSRIVFLKRILRVRSAQGGERIADADRRVV
jgi:hypothetical protein